MAETRLFFWLCLLVKVSPSVSSDVVGHEPVQVSVGDDVILPCHLAPPSDVSKLTVEWMWNGVTVHLYRDWADNYDDQDQQFRNRTSLFHSELTRGNISLKLTNVHQEDAGLYICYVPRLESRVKRGNVFLTINPRNEAREQGGDKMTQGGDEPTEDDPTGVIVGSILAPLLVIIAVSAVIVYLVDKETGFIRCWRRRRNNQEDDGKREKPNGEVMTPMNPPTHIPA